MTTQCRKHKKYRAIRKPTVNCIWCWIQWAEAHPDEPITGKVFSEVMLYLMSEIGINRAASSSASAAASTALYVANKYS